MGHNGPVLSGNKRFQRITVGVIIGLVVMALALTLVGPALAAPAAGMSPLRESGSPLAEAAASTPTANSSGLVGTANPRPVTDTPQGTMTQVSDQEHLGGLVAYLAFMVGGALLLVRAKHRERRERVVGASEPIL